MLFQRGQNMSSLDWLVTNRILSRIALVVFVFFGLICLTESLDSWRFEFLTNTRGQDIAILAIVANAARWSIKALPVTVLIGGIIALIDLQSHRELLVIKASGISIWRIIYTPIIAIAIIAASISVFIDAKVTEINRSIMPSLQTTTQSVGGNKQVWLEQSFGEMRYVIEGDKIGFKVYELKNITVFLPPKSEYSRVEAKTGYLSNGEWLLENVTLFAPSKAAKIAEKYSIATSSNISELELRLASTDDFTFFELKDALASDMNDPIAQAAAATRFAKLMALPALLVGVLLIAFAFTSQFRRTDSYGRVIVTGIILGFIVFVITEMADRAGSAGVLSPMLAAWGSPIVAIVIGITVLLYKEDGET